MFEIKCDIPADSVQKIEDFLCEYVRSNWSIFNVRPGEPFLLRGYFEEKDEWEESYQELKKKFKFLPADPECVEMDDQEWKDAYKAFIQPWSSRGLHWVPVWKKDEYVIPAGEHAIYLDAGMAFGTGSHETTRLMAMRLLDYLENCDAEALKQRSIIDAGCGSGILAISAARLGFARVYGFDRDPEAIRVSRENVVFNQLTLEQIEFAEAGLEDGLQNRKADLMLANIQADVLQIHAEGILRAMAPGGVLSLSGILVKEIAKLRDLFEAKAFEICGRKVATDSREDGEWADLSLVMP